MSQNCDMKVNAVMIGEIGSTRMIRFTRMGKNNVFKRYQWRQILNQFYKENSRISPRRIYF